ncbi:hypothetical protein BLX88_15285 [Bacillus obstructivus]|uniref:Uncharacterized protein n=1 Tax=Heyndrickxia oleronia TaxID=38875 RepID=A0A8E2I9M2_9BACI|nr:hypothetical protein BLX88_15285 [Bacillus obstructivus]OOP68862.1 hypothetical protein BWZ43_08175 [Heyndrickxia oleronia]
MNFFLRFLILHIHKSLQLTKRFLKFHIKINTKNKGCNFHKIRLSFLMKGIEQIALFKKKQPKMKGCNKWSK